MMNPRRFTQVTTAFGGTLGLAGLIVASLPGFGSSGVKSAGAAPIEDHRLPTLATEVADASQATAMGYAVVASADVAAAVEAVTGMAAGTAAPAEPEPIVLAALPDASQIVTPEMPSGQEPAVSSPDPAPGDIRETVSRIEIHDECLVAEACIDQFLWALYQRTRKQDTIKVYEQKKVTVKVTVRKKRKTVTVNKTITKTFTRLVDNDFTWKDPKAAERIGMPMMDYVIGGMDRSFKLKLFHALHAAEQAGLSPGITSAFRDDYRQSIASGLKAASDRSYHGGSSRGGYGHGLAADVVSVKGATRAQRWVSTEILWKWIDANEKEFGIGRPYLNRDPPHVAPIDGKEYASRRGSKAQQAEAKMKKRDRLAARNDRSARHAAPAHRRKADTRVVAQARR